jgi:hypothetical protein
MKRALRDFQTPIFVITILMAAVSGTIAPDDPPDKLQSHVDESGKDSAPSQFEIIKR